LVSVRDLREAQIATAAGADIVDFKEPARGPLGAAPPSIWDEASRSLPSGMSLSAALGECAEATALARRVPSQFRFAKAGPAGSRSATQLASAWQRIRDGLNASVELVAVAYADSDAADAPAPELVFREAAKRGLRRCLVDTYLKDGRSTFDHLPLARLRELSEIAASLGLWWALAGSLTLGTIPSAGAGAISVNCFGVRGDVCRGGRSGELDPARVAAWHRALRAYQTHSARPTINRRPDQGTSSGKFNRSP
jgi:hypothetical protein